MMTFQRLIHPRIHYYNNPIISSTSTSSSTTSSTTTILKRFVSSCIHIKGLPTTLPNSFLYNFFKNYGDIIEFTTFQEASMYNNHHNHHHHNNGTTTSNGSSSRKKLHYINHSRPPGTTAIVSFHNTTSAIICKEELHWRPFPIMNIIKDDEYDEYDDENNNNNVLHRPLLDKNIIKCHPRDRPLVNILFETNHMRNKLRAWVKRDLVKSKHLIRKWGYPYVRRSSDVEDGSDDNVVDDDDEEEEEEEVNNNNYDDDDSDDEKLVESCVTEMSTKNSIIVSDFYSMKLVELQQECKNRNLPYYGRKAELLHRLEASMK